MREGNPCTAELHRLPFGGSPGCIDWKLTRLDTRAGRVFWPWRLPGWGGVESAKHLITWAKPPPSHCTPEIIHYYIHTGANPASTVHKGLSRVTWTWGIIHLGSYVHVVDSRSTCTDTVGDNPQDHLESHAFMVLAWPCKSWRSPLNSGGGGWCKGLEGGLSLFNRQI